MRCPTGELEGGGGSAERNQGTSRQIGGADRKRIFRSFGPEDGEPFREMPPASAEGAAYGGADRFPGK